MIKSATLILVRRVRFLRCIAYGGAAANRGYDQHGTGATLQQLRGGGGREDEVLSSSLRQVPAVPFNFQLQLVTARCNCTWSDAIGHGQQQLDAVKRGQMWSLAGRG